MQKLFPLLHKNQYHPPTHLGQLKALNILLHSSDWNMHKMHVNILKLKWRLKDDNVYSVYPFMQANDHLNM